MDDILLIDENDFILEIIKDIKTLKDFKKVNKFKNNL